MKKALGKAIGVLVIVFVLGVVNLVQIPKYDHSNSDWPATATIQQFYEMEENSLDVIFLGSSVAVNAFSPHELYNDFGIRSYNLSTPHQSVFMSYWVLREALRFQHPQAVVLDCRFCFDLNPEEPLNMSEGVVRQVIDPMKWSSVKREAISDICAHDDAHDIVSYYLTNLRYHERWKDMSPVDFDLSISDPLFGWSAVKGEYEEIKVFMPQDPDARTAMDPLMEEYLEKIRVLCETEGIRLILVDVPGNNTDDGTYNTLSAYAGAHDLRYYNFASGEVVDTFGEIRPYERLTTHANYFGMKKLTRFIGSILQFSCGITGQPDAQFEDQTYFRAMEDNANVNAAETPEELFRALDRGHFIVFWAVNEDGWNDLGEAERTLWHALGMNEEPFTASRYSYVSVTGAGEVMSADTAELSGAFGEHHYRVVSQGYASGRTASVIIDGEEYALNKKGLNAVVFDLASDRVIESVLINGNEVLR